jgi:enoyl-CoA hydratase/carnithine racemase
MEYTHITPETDGPVGILTLDRPAKFNAINHGLLFEIEHYFDTLPDEIGAVVIRSSGQHFCAGLDLLEHSMRDAAGAMHECRLWHRIFDKIEYGRVPVVAAMNGGVLGGGMELAMTAHIRVSQQDTFYELPEGRRAIFVGGGATVRVGRIIGASRMMEMMLTGRRYGSDEGLQLGLAHYVEPDGTVFDKAMELAKRVTENAPLSNYMMMQAITRINDMSASDGFFTESLAAAIAQSSPEARAGMEAFLRKTGKRDNQ